MPGLKILITVLFLSLLGFSIEAANSGAVLINEIAWMGSKTSHADEWIKLRNNTASSVNLAGWTLRAADGSPSAKLTKNDVISDFYLLKRGKNYTGALENSGEILELYDNLGNLIDKVDASSGWPAGDNAAKLIMKRTSFGWQTGQKETPPVQAAVFSEPFEQAADNQAPKSLYLFLVAGALAVFSGGMILFLKKKLV